MTVFTRYLMLIGYYIDDYNHPTDTVYRQLPNQIGSQLWSEKQARLR